MPSFGIVSGHVAVSTTYYKPNNLYIPGIWVSQYWRLQVQHHSGSVVRFWWGSSSLRPSRRKGQERQLSRVHLWGHSLTKLVRVKPWSCPQIRSIHTITLQTVTYSELSRGSWRETSSKGPEQPLCIGQLRWNKRKQRWAQPKQEETHSYTLSISCPPRPLLACDPTKSRHNQDVKWIDDRKFINSASTWTHQPPPRRSFISDCHI